MRSFPAINADFDAINAEFSADFCPASRTSEDKAAWAARVRSRIARRDVLVTELRAAYKHTAGTKAHPVRGLLRCADCQRVGVIWDHRMDGSACLECGATRLPRCKRPA